MPAVVASVVIIQDMGFIQLFRFSANNLIFSASAVCYSNRLQQSVTAVSYTV